MVALIPRRFGDSMTVCFDPRPLGIGRVQAWSFLLFVLFVHHQRALGVIIEASSPSFVTRAGALKQRII